MSELKLCPCGKRPNKLFISDGGHSGKWAIACGNCCYAWNVHFGTQLFGIGSDECMKIAIKEWNGSLRA